MTTRLTARGRLKHALALLAGLALAAGAIAALAEPPRAGFSPDPPAHASVKQWVFDVRIQRGRPTIEKARSTTVGRPYETARVMGRYALELYVGPELLDRIRFNVPLAGDGPLEDVDRPRKNPFPRPRFENVTTRIRVQMADHPRAAYLALVDRATGDVERFEWPPPPSGSLVPVRRASATIASPATSEPSKTDAGRPSPPPPSPLPLPSPNDGGADSGADAGVEFDGGGIPDASLRPARRGR